MRSEKHYQKINFGKVYHIFKNMISLLTKNPLIRKLSASESLMDHMSSETIEANTIIGVKQAGLSTKY